jgi:outer membrane protein assembly factor BamD (BamD/ComL family)
MTKPVYASALALLLFTSVGLPNTSSSPINVETNVTHQSFSEEAALREAAELIRQSQFGGESLGAAEIGLARLYKEHRDSRIAELLAALLDGAHEKRAEQDLCIAMYYMYKQSNYPAAEHRLKLITSEYPKYLRLDEVSYQLAIIQIETGRAAEAEKTLQGLLARFGCSARARDAQEKLESLRSGK